MLEIASCRLSTRGLGMTLASTLTSYSFLIGDYNFIFPTLFFILIYFELAGVKGQLANNVDCSFLIQVTGSGIFTLRLCVFFIWVVGEDEQYILFPLAERCSSMSWSSQKGMDSSSSLQMLQISIDGVDDLKVFCTLARMLYKLLDGVTKYVIFLLALGQNSFIINFSPTSKS